MNSKAKSKKALETEIAERQKLLTANDCPMCSQHFYSPLNREAHMQRYPEHFSIASAKQ